MRHALVHAADDDQRSACCVVEREIAEGGEAEGEGDRHAGEHHAADDADEEDEQVEVAERLQQPAAAAQKTPTTQRRRRARQHACASCRARSSRRTANDEHQRDADRQRRGAPGVGDLERRRGDDDFVARELVGRPGRSSSRKASAAAIATTSRKTRTAGTSMPTTAVMRMCSPRRSATHRAQHREPQEQDRGELVRPDERLVEARSARSRRRTG